MAEKKKVEKEEVAPTLKERAVHAYEALLRLIAVVVLVAFAIFCGWFICVRIWSAPALLNLTYLDVGWALVFMKIRTGLKIILPIVTAAALAHLALKHAKAQINPPAGKKHVDHRKMPGHVKFVLCSGLVLLATAVSFLLAPLLYLKEVYEVGGWRNSDLVNDQPATDALAAGLMFSEFIPWLITYVVIWAIIQLLFPEPKAGHH